MYIFSLPNMSAELLEIFLKSWDPLMACKIRCLHYQIQVFKHHQVSGHLRVFSTL